MSKPFSHAELFAIPESSGDTIVFAPLHGLALRLSPLQLNLLIRVRNGQGTAADLSSPLIRALLDAGLDKEVPPPLSSVCATSDEFRPRRLTLLLTTACNLRCIYCYAGSHSCVTTMPVDLGKAAIDELFRLASESGHHQVDVGFHGGGEPTCAWDELTTLVDYARAQSESTGITCGLGIATNGCLHPAKAAWIGTNFNNVNLSLDGPPRLHDRQRPKADGKASSPFLRRTMRELEKANCPYACQATVTADTVTAMPDIVRYVSRHTRATELKFEPVMPEGQFRDADERVPTAERFAQYFDAAHSLGLRLGLKVVFSALRIFGPPQTCFCGAFDTPFNVTPDGFLSACYETFLGSSEYQDAFIFGRYLADERRFAIDKEKLQSLRQRHLMNLPSCRECFCKYACAGDCASRNFHHFGKPDLYAVGARCELIRAIIQRQLQRILAATEQGHPTVLQQGGHDNGCKKQI